MGTSSLTWQEVLLEGQTFTGATVEGSSELRLTLTQAHTQIHTHSNFSLSGESAGIHLLDLQLLLQDLEHLLHVRDVT